MRGAMSGTLHAKPGDPPRSALAKIIPEENDMKILMVLTSHDQLGNTGKKTGFWL